MWKLVTPRALGLGTLQDVGPRPPWLDFILVACQSRYITASAARSSSTRACSSCSHLAKMLWHGRVLTSTDVPTEEQCKNEAVDHLVSVCACLCLLGLRGPGRLVMCIAFYIPSIQASICVPVFSVLRCRDDCACEARVHSCLCRLVKTFALGRQGNVKQTRSVVHVFSGASGGNRPLRRFRHGLVETGGVEAGGSLAAMSELALKV